MPVTFPTRIRGSESGNWVKKTLFTLITINTRPEHAWVLGNELDVGQLSTNLLCPFLSMDKETMEGPGEVCLV